MLNRSHHVCQAPSEGKTTLFIVYVDDIVIARDDQGETERLKRLLDKKFEVKDLGKLKYFLGVEVAPSTNGILMSLRNYTLDLLRETSILGCKPIDTPMDLARKGGVKEESTLTNKDRYQKLVRKLIYLTYTRPDIGFVVSMASRYMNNPSECHMKAIN